MQLIKWGATKSVSQPVCKRNNVNGIGKIRTEAQRVELSIIVFCVCYTYVDSTSLKEMRRKTISMMILDYIIIEEVERSRKAV